MWTLSNTLYRVSTVFASIWPLSFSEEAKISPYSGGVLIMRNNEVYFITRDSNDLSLRGGHDAGEFPPFVPVKVDELCGKEIRGSHMISRV